MSSTRLSWTCHCANHLTLHAVLCIFFSGDTIDQVHEIFIFRAMYQQRARLAFPRSKLRACPGPACRSRAPHLECALSRDESRFSLFVKLSRLGFGLCIPVCTSAASRLPLIGPVIAQSQHFRPLPPSAGKEACRIPYFTPPLFSVVSVRRFARSGSRVGLSPLSRLEESMYSTLFSGGCSPPRAGIVFRVARPHPPPSPFPAAATHTHTHTHTHVVGNHDSPSRPRAEARGCVRGPAVMPGWVL
mmetsp:Transcript_27667/g.80894  ORF Transcript_27667/g.80894 Transcript_27667/m.80894 type:complete len:245 (+) Transcript_27667:205-939(+)